MNSYAPHVPEKWIPFSKSPLRLSVFLLAGFGSALFALKAQAQGPEFNPKYPLQFYEMARRQGTTDASCAAAAKNVAWVIEKYGKSSPKLVPVWQLRLGDALRAAGKEREALAAYGQILALSPNTPVGEFGPYRDVKAYQRECRAVGRVLRPPERRG